MRPHGMTIGTCKRRWKYTPGRVSDLQNIYSDGSGSLYSLKSAQKKLIKAPPQSSLIDPLHRRAATSTHMALYAVFRFPLVRFSAPRGYRRLLSPSRRGRFVYAANSRRIPSIRAKIRTRLRSIPGRSHASSASSSGGRGEERLSRADILHAANICTAMRSRLLPMPYYSPADGFSSMDSCMSPTPICLPHSQKGQISGDAQSPEYHF